MALITPVLLCGGTGTRLWPLSRKSYPKQFAQLVGDTSLFQASAQRVAGAGFAPPLLLTNSDYRFIVTEQLAAIGIDPGPILIEPEGRNTAPAILAAAIHLHASDPGAMMLVAPSDHVVDDITAFHDAVRLGMAAAREGQIVTFGITPTRPETGYGYLKVAGSGEGGGPLPLERFVEKPGPVEAERMIADGSHLWNAGIFLFSVETILSVAARHAHDLLEAVTHAVQAGRPDLGFLRLDPEAWARAENISIDYAVMERADNLVVVPYSGGWSDLGDWDAVWRGAAEAETEVATFGPATAIDCEHSLLRAEDPRQTLVGLGLKNIIAVAMPDAVLVADLSRAQEVRRAVDALSRTDAPQAVQLPRDYRPWGWFESLVVGERFQVKRIHVHPGGALSLQSHEMRAEHWVVVQGTAQVTVGDKVRRVSENQSVYVPVGARHRLENTAEDPLILIEVQTGTYFGEDDIVRYSDVYQRD